MTGDKNVGMVLYVIPVIRGWDFLSQKDSYNKDYNPYDKIIIKILIQNMEVFQFQKLVKIQS